MTVVFARSICPFEIASSRYALLAMTILSYSIRNSAFCILHSTFRICTLYIVIYSILYSLSSIPYSLASPINAYDSIIKT